MSNKVIKAVGLCLLTVVAVVVVALGQMTDKPAKRVPKLSNDDVGVSSEAMPSADGAPGMPAGEGAEYAGGPIAWQTDLGRARDLANYNKGVVVVDVYTDWCGWCHKMDEVIYSNPKVAALGAHNVFVKLNAEDKDQGEEFARENGVRSFPTTIILDGEGHQLKVLTGYISSPDAFVQLVQTASKAVPR
jgi:thiol-disulfide isomerase/thioredoxin